MDGAWTGSDSGRFLGDIVGIAATGRYLGADLTCCTGLVGTRAGSDAVLYRFFGVIATSGDFF